MGGEEGDKKEKEVHVHVCGSGGGGIIFIRGSNH